MVDLSLALSWRVGIDRRPEQSDRQRNPTGVSQRPRLQVFVYAYAAISSDHLKVAKEVATGIYTNVGVPVEWVECYLAEEELNPTRSAAG